MISANATIPVEVEREKDFYYFKIHGHPLPGGGDYGVADCIYKNLSPEEQYIIIELETTLTIGGVPYTHTGGYEGIVADGSEVQLNPLNGDLGAEVNFKLYIDDPGKLSNPELEMTIVIPPS